MHPENKVAARHPNKAQVMAAPGDLKQRCLRPGNPSTAALQAIANADQAMKDLSVNFHNWMANESLRLRKARDAAKSSRFALGPMEELFHASHDLKGQASTLGYPLAAEVCASLCRLLEMVTDRKRIPPVLVDQHVDAVRAIVREGATGDDNPTALVLLNKLRDVTDAYISDEISLKTAAGGA